MNACEALTAGASAGVAPALRAVDCVANQMAASAFSRLFGAEGAMGPVLTIVLTLYIAFFALSLLTGRASLGLSALTPRMLTLGLVLTFATSWLAYQGVVWNLAVGGPDWIASILLGSNGSAASVFADRIDVLFTAITTAANDGQPEGAAAASGGAAAASLLSPQGLLWLGATLLLLGTVGVLLTARIALGILLAVGPVFVVMALFTGTRGLTAGWLRALALTALTPLFVVLGGAITIELLVPVLAGLAQVPGQVDGRAAMALFVIACVHVALMIMVLRIAGTMVAAWGVFGMGNADRTRRDSEASFAHAARSAPPPAPVAAVQVSRHAATARVAGAMPSGQDGANAAYSAGSTAAPSRSRTGVVTQVKGAGLAPIAAKGDVRTRGIGSTFRAASNDRAGPGPKENIR